MRARARRVPAAVGDAEVSTRVKIMLAAERLFGELGIDAVPLRLVSKEAGQKNTNAVQYHFGGRLQLLRAIFEYREAQLEPLRKSLLEKGQASDRLADVRWLLHVCFAPNFELYRHGNGLSYIKLHAQYLSTHRPRGVAHPVDDKSPSTESLRAAIDLLHRCLACLDEHLFMLRLESVGTLFLGAVIQNAARPRPRRLPADELFADILEMMAAAIGTQTVE
jgi:AcrR family transcriptional regulator